MAGCRAANCQAAGALRGARRRSRALRLPALLQPRPGVTGPGGSVPSRWRCGWWPGSGAAGLRSLCWADIVGVASLRVERIRTEGVGSSCTSNTRFSPPGGGGGRSPRLRGRGRRLAAALLCALLAAVTVAVEPPGQPAEAAASDQSQDPPAAPTTSAPAPTTSAPAETPADPLSGLRASLSGGSVSLSWISPEGNDAISKYQYQIKTMGAGGAYGAWTDISGSGASTVAHTIAVTGSERRNVRVQAVNAEGVSIYYGVASTDVSDAPSGLRASLSGGSVSLSWDDPGDDSIDSYWYQIKKAGAGNTYSALIEIDDSDASTTSATIIVTGQGRRIVELQARPATHPGWGAIYKSAAASTGPPDAPSGVERVVER